MHCHLYTNKLHLVTHNAMWLQVCADRGGSEEEVEGEVREILAEMGHSMFLPAVRLIALLLRPFIRSALHGIFVNRDGLEQVFFGLLCVLLIAHESMRQLTKPLFLPPNFRWV